MKIVYEDLSIRTLKFGMEGWLLGIIKIMKERKTVKRKRVSQQRERKQVLVEQWEESGYNGAHRSNDLAPIFTGYFKSSI